MLSRFVALHSVRPLLVRHVCGVSAIRFSKKKEELEQKIDNYEEDKSARHKLKVLVRDYGATAMVVHITISLFSLGTCYLIVRSGLPVGTLLHELSFVHDEGKGYLQSAGTFAIAYLVHKSLVLIRLGATIAVTPILVNTLRRKGILKPIIEKTKKDGK